MLIIVFIVIFYFICVGEACFTVSGYSPFVGSTCNYTLSANIGSMPSTSKMIVNISFNTAYKFTEGTIVDNQLTIDQNNDERWIKVQIQRASSFTLIIKNIRNPIISQKMLGVTIQILDASGNIYESCTQTLKFTQRQLFDDNIDFVFANNATSSYTTLYYNVKIPIYDPTMHLQISMNDRWTYQVPNKIFPDGPKCSKCDIKTAVNYYQFDFNDLEPIEQNGWFIYKAVFYSIISPPTLQRADKTQVRIIENTSNTYVFSNNKSQIYSLQLANGGNWSAYCVSETSQILNFRTQVHSNTGIDQRGFVKDQDQIIIKLNQEYPLLDNTTSENISIYRYQINSCQIQIMDRNKIKLYNIYFKSVYFYQEYIYINGVTPSPSNKTINGTLTFYRHNYPYSRMTFYYNAVPKNFPGQITIINNISESNTEWSLQITPPGNILPGDVVILQFTVTIQVYSCSAQCKTCKCISNSSSFVKINEFSSQYSSLKVSGEAKNPRRSGQKLVMRILDVQGYQKGQGVINYPDVEQIAVAAKELSLSMENSQVYGLGSYTLTYNFENFNPPISGSITTQFPGRLTVQNYSISSCTVNELPNCNIISTHPFIFSFDVESGITVYAVIITNVRNPKTTQYFNVIGKNYSPSQELMQQFTTSQKKVNLLYFLSEGSEFNYSVESKMNNHPNTLNIDFRLPFNFSTEGFTSSDHLILKITNLKISQIHEISCNLTSSSSLAPVSYQFTNWRSLQSINYGFLLTTEQIAQEGNLQILRFSIQLENEEADNLTINSFSFTGLLGDSDGSLTINYTRKDNNIPNYSLRIQFPPEYSDEISVSSSYQTTKISKRMFQLSGFPAGNTTLVFTISGFANYNSTDFSISDYESNYLISRNNYTVSYDLSDVSSCTFPCKLCSFEDGQQICAECYPFTITEYYLLNQIAFECVKSCPLGTYKEGMSCKACPVQCQACKNSTSCLVCQQQQFVHEDKCLTDCPAGTFPQNQLKQCHSCISPCLTCINQEKCKSCTEGYFFMSIGTCVQQCPFKYVQIDGQCELCESPCLSCQGNISFCMSCVSDYYLFENNCFEDCPNDLLEFNSSCIECQFPCKTCQNTATLCLSCQSPYQMINGSCQVVCPQSCEVCSNSSDCLFCLPGKLLYQEKCYDSCPDSTYINGTQCLQCILLGCLQCVSLDICRVCEPQYRFYSGQCIQKDCQLPCKTCLVGSPYACTSCIKNKYLYESSCIDNCPAGFYENQEKLICEKCYDQCESCNQNGCTSCKSNLKIQLSIQAENKIVAKCIQQTSNNNNNNDNGNDNNGNGNGNNSDSNNTYVPPPWSQTPPITTVPFSLISTLGLLGVYEIGKSSVGSAPALALISAAGVLGVACNVFYLNILEKNPEDDQKLMLALYFLISGLSLNYLGNILHTISSYCTFRKDPKFLQYAEQNCCPNFIIGIFALASSQYTFSLYFCRMCNAKAFSAQLFDPKKLKYLNFAWGFSVIANLVGIGGGVCIILSNKVDQMMGGVDAVVVNALGLVLGIVLFPKNTSFWTSAIKPNKNSTQSNQISLTVQNNNNHASSNRLHPPLPPIKNKYSIDTNFHKSGSQSPKQQQVKRKIEKSLSGKNKISNSFNFSQELNNESAHNHSANNSRVNLHGNNEIHEEKEFQDESGNK